MRGTILWYLVAQSTFLDVVRARRVVESRRTQIANRDLRCDLELILMAPLLPIGLRNHTCRAYRDAVGRKRGKDIEGGWTYASASCEQEVTTCIHKA